METGALRTGVYWRVQLQLCLQAERRTRTSPPVHKAPDQACSDCPWLAGGGQFQREGGLSVFPKERSWWDLKEGCVPLKGRTLIADCAALELVMGTRKTSVLCVWCRSDVNST